jgi:lipoyl synthase
VELQRYNLMRAERPHWLNRKIDFKQMHATQESLSGLGLNTVCNHALCPNISECYARKTATFLILGSICTRQCLFCNVHSGAPQPIDASEPERVAEAVQRLSLRYAVITSVTRDDLPDGGAEHFAQTVNAIRRINPQTKIELLIPDFSGSDDSLETVLASMPDVLGHNIEMVSSLYKIRKGASYERSLELLKSAKQTGSSIVKSGIMLGLGETDAEIRLCLRDIRDTGAEYISIGQYLQPSKENIPVVEYITPERFEEYKHFAIDIGFRHAESGPYVRSSYMADQYN